MRLKASTSAGCRAGGETGAYSDPCPLALAHLDAHVFGRGLDIAHLQGTDFGEAQACSVGGGQQGTRPDLPQMQEPGRLAFPGSWFWADPA